MKENEKAHGWNLDDALKSAYDNWETEKGEGAWPELNESLDLELEFKDQQEKFEEWSTFAPKEIWEKIHNSLSEESVLNLVQESYANWNAKAPNKAYKSVKNSINEASEVGDFAKEVIAEQGLSYFQLKKVAALFLALILAWFTRDDYFSTASSSFVGVFQANSSSYKNSNQGVSINIKDVPVNKNRLVKRQVGYSQTPVDLKLQKFNSSNQNSTKVTTSNFKRLVVSKLSLKKVLINSEIKAQDISSLPTQSVKKGLRKFQLGAYVAQSSNLINGWEQQIMTSRGVDLGYEAGLLISHPWSFFEQEHLISFVKMKQVEWGYNNGRYTQSILAVSGLKYTTLTKLNVHRLFSAGLGLTALFPTSANKIQESTLVGLPKTNFLNLGMSSSVDWHPNLFRLNQSLMIGLKYEHIFGLSEKRSHFKSYQNLSLGIKFKI